MKINRIKLNFIKNARNFLIERSKILAVIESCQSEEQLLCVLDWSRDIFSRRKQLIEKHTCNWNAYDNLLQEVSLYRIHIEGIIFNKLKNQSL